MIKRKWPVLSFLILLLCVLSVGLARPDDSSKLKALSLYWFAFGAPAEAAIRKAAATLRLTEGASSDRRALTSLVMAVIEFLSLR